MKNILKVLFVFSIVFFGFSHSLVAQAKRKSPTPTPTLSIQDQKLMERARKILGKDKPKYFNEFEHFCNLGLGDGRELTEVKSKYTQFGKWQYQVTFYIFYWKNGKVNMAKIEEETYRDSGIEDLRIVRVPGSKQDLIWIGEDDYGEGGNCHLFAAVDGKLKEVLTYPGDSEEPTSGVGIFKYLLPGANRTLTVLTEIADNHTATSSLSLYIQRYAWNAKQKIYKPSGTNHPISLIESVLVAWGNGDFLKASYLKDEALKPENQRLMKEYIGMKEHKLASKRVQIFLDSLKTNN